MRSLQNKNPMPVVLLLIAASVSFASDSEPKQADGPTLTVPATSATVEKIMERAVQNIARRYNLNETQTQLTDELMRKEVNKFLLEHEDDVWPVIRDLLASQLGGKPPPNVEDAKRIGRTARPLADLAEDAIFRANSEWRKILTEDQKKVHDFDMAEMKKTFKQIDENFGAWAEGKATDTPLIPHPDIRGRDVKRPAKPIEKPRREYHTPEVNWGVDTLFDTLVEEFIKNCKLDESQIGTARSILKEFKAKANDIKNALKHDFGKLAADEKKAIESHNRTDLKRVAGARKKLLKPVYGLVPQMDERLKGLLTSVQIELCVQKDKDSKKKPEPTREASRKPSTDTESKTAQDEAAPKKRMVPSKKNTAGTSKPVESAP